jgi:hypothetical protein
MGIRKTKEREDFDNSDYLGQLSPSTAPAEEGSTVCATHHLLEVQEQFYGRVVRQRRRPALHMIIGS